MSDDKYYSLKEIIGENEDIAKLDEEQVAALFDIDKRLLLADNAGVKVFDESDKLNFQKIILKVYGRKGLRRTTSCLKSAIKNVCSWEYFCETFMLLKGNEAYKRLISDTLTSEDYDSCYEILRIYFDWHECKCGGRSCKDVVLSWMNLKNISISEIGRALGDSELQGMLYAALNSEEYKLAPKNRIKLMDTLIKDFGYGYAAESKLVYTKSKNNVLTAKAYCSRFCVPEYLISEMDDVITDIEREFTEV